MQYKHKIILVLTILLFFASCNWFTSDNPCRKHIDRRVMVGVLTDVFLLEAQLSQTQYQNGISDSVPYFYAAIFEKHDITSDQFEMAYECYLLDQDNMIWIMDEVLSSLSIIQSRISEKREDQN